MKKTWFILIIPLVILLSLVVVIGPAWLSTSFFVWLWGECTLAYNVGCLVWLLLFGGFIGWTMDKNLNEK